MVAPRPDDASPMRTVYPEHLVLRASGTPLAPLGRQFGRCPSRAPFYLCRMASTRASADRRDLSASMDRAWQASSSSLITSGNQREESPARMRCVLAHTLGEWQGRVEVLR